jgi:hypothetical protein
MDSRPLIAISWVLFLAMFTLVTAVVVARFRSEKPSGIAIIAAALPGLVMLGLFYSLAIHMHRSLGTWPNYIGEKGFSPLLIAHSEITINYFGASFFLALFVWPIFFILCLTVPRWRRLVKYLAVCAFSFFASYSLMMLAPSPFLSWWWD